MAKRERRVKSVKKNVTRTTRKLPFNRENSHSYNTNLEIQDISPLTDNQRLAFEAYDNGNHLFLAGSAGTGKTFLSVFLALQEILDGDSPYEKLIIVRSAVQSRAMGFLPGSLEEKSDVYAEPYKIICSELFKRGDAFEILRKKGIIEFMTTSYLRGTTFSNAIVLVDEIQNAISSECSTVLTRVGQNSKIIFCGDIRQNDLARTREKSGMTDFIKIIKHMKEFDMVEFGVEDIVRSSLVKSFIETCYKLEDDGSIEPFM